MVNVKAFAIVVLLTIGIVIVALSSLADSNQEVQASFAAPNRLPSLADNSGGASGGAELSTDHLPLMVRWSNWRPEFGPAYVYAREADMNGMLDLNAPVEKMLMVTSYAEVQRVTGRADQLQAAGVTTIGFNTENGPGMTPSNEMQTISSSDPEVNVVARAAVLATASGFEVLWGPVRRTVDSLSDEAVLTMMEAGVTGLAIQEQKFIENQDASARLSAVLRTRERYLRLADRAGIEDFSFHVQIMHQRCPNLPNCVNFVEGLEEIPVDSIAIWSNGPIPVDFVSAIRMQ
ncbi:MAG: hypothetical protein R3293_11385 [Candidatus Promineifilaceae bacterium]|nr:hypothetical protein [Candidatus Promineifilaceae bacterium]